MSTTLAPLGTNDMDGLPSNLRVVGATKHYEGFTLGPVDLDVPQESIVGLIGQNGAGKTTLMKAIMGTIHLDGGTVNLFGKDASDLSDTEFALLKNHIGYVGAVCSYPQAMTVTEVAKMHGLAYQRFDQTLFDSYAQQMGLLPSSAKKRAASCVIRVAFVWIESVRCRPGGRDCFARVSARLKNGSPAKSGSPPWKVREKESKGNER